EGQRMQRIAQLMRLWGGEEGVRYVGTDEFESARDGARHLSLKQAHRMAAQLGLRAALIPGEIAAALPRVAHKLGACDLVVINEGLDPNQPTEGIVASWLNRLAHS